MSWRPIAAMLAPVVLAAGGCGSSMETSRYGGARPSLVMADPGPAEAGGRAWRVDPGAWEYGRNDDHLNSRGPQPVFGYEWAEIRDTSRTRTSNGTPREFSSTTVRTLRRGLSW